MGRIESAEVLGYNKKVSIFKRGLNIFVRTLDGNEYKVYSKCEDVSKYPRGSRLNICIHEGFAKLVV